MKFRATAIVVLILVSGGLFSEAPAGYSEALDLYAAGKFEDSLTKVRSIFEANKNSCHVRMLAAANHARAGRTNDAIQHLLYCIKEHPEQANAMAMLAAIYRKDGSFGQATDWINRASGVEPRNEQIQLEAARIYYKAGQYPQARKVLEGLIASSNGEALALDGLTLLRQGNFDNAIFRFRAALNQPATKNDLSNMHVNMAIALKKAAEQADKTGSPAEASQKRTEASEHIAKALELNPDNSYAKQTQ